MTIKFLQAEQDIDQFVSYLYNLGYSLARSGGALKGVLLEFQRAKALLLSDLVCTMSGSCYWIIAESKNIVLEMVSCGRRSHPRCTDRMCRYPGLIAHCHGWQITESAEILMKELYLFFKKNYIKRNCQSKVKEYGFWGAHYQLIDEAYTQNPEPTYLCPGYIRVVDETEHTETVLARVRDVLSQYPSIQQSYPVCTFPRDQLHGIEVYVGFLCDRNEFDLRDLERLVDELGESPGRVLARKEKLYIEADTAYRNRKYPNTKWNAYGFVENEWRGFGNFDS